MMEKMRHSFDGDGCAACEQTWCVYANPTDSWASALNEMTRKPRVYPVMQDPASDAIKELERRLDEMARTDGNGPIMGKSLVYCSEVCRMNGCMSKEDGIGRLDKLTKELEKRIETLEDGESHTYNWFGACPACCRNGGILPSLAVGCALAPKSQIEKLKQKLGKGEWDELQRLDALEWKIDTILNEHGIPISFTVGCDKDEETLEQKHQRYLAGELALRMVRESVLMNFPGGVKDKGSPEGYMAFERILGLGESRILLRAREKLSRCLIETSDGEDSVGLYLSITFMQELHKAIGEAIEFMRRGDDQKDS